MHQALTVLLTCSLELFLPRQLLGPVLRQVPESDSFQTPLFSQQCNNFILALHLASFSWTIPLLSVTDLPHSPGKAAGSPYSLRRDSLNHFPCTALDGNNPCTEVFDSDERGENWASDAGAPTAAISPLQAHANEDERRASVDQMSSQPLRPAPPELPGV